METPIIYIEFVGNGEYIIYDNTSYIGDNRNLYLIYFKVIDSKGVNIVGSSDAATISSVKIKPKDGWYKVSMERRLAADGTLDSKTDVKNLFILWNIEQCRDKAANEALSNCHNDLLGEKWQKLEIPINVIHKLTAEMRYADAECRLRLVETNCNCGC